jgi:hypothetical protein
MSGKMVDPDEVLDAARAMAKIKEHDREIEKAIKNGDFEAVEWHYEQEDRLFARLKASLELGAETRAALAKYRRKTARERTAARWHAQKAA